MIDFRIAAAVAATLIAPSAFAAPVQTADTIAAASQATVVQPGAATAKRYCIVETPTGSRIPQKTCQTREDWLDEGVDVLKTS